MSLLKDKWIVRDEADINVGVGLVPETLSIAVAPAKQIEYPSTNVDAPKVYILYGETGEYSDKSTWAVGAYLCKDKACARLDFLNQVLKDNDIYKHKHQDVMCDGSVVARAKEQMASHPDGDINLRVDYTGSCYHVEEIPLLS